VSTTLPAGDRAAPARAAPNGRRVLVALVRRGLRDNRRAPLTWGGALGGMTALMAAIWPSIEDSTTKLVVSYPSSLKEAFGIQRLDSIEKYVDAEMLSLIVPLTLAFFAVRCATRATVGGEDRGYLDTLLSLPVSRRALVGGSFIVTAIVLGAILAVVWGMTWVAGTLVGGGISGDTLAAGLVNVWPLAMLSGGIAVFAAGFSHRPSTVTAIGAGAVVAMYVVDLVGKLADPVEPLRTLSAFRYYGSAIQDGLNAGHMIGLTIVALALAATGSWLFERRDLS
jgi:ABC-2 type transport system permease protein